MSRHLRRGLASAYILAVTAVLGFGIKEATAAPAVKAAAELCNSPAEFRACTEWCDSMGWSYDYAVCTEYGCECHIRMCGNAPC